MEPEGRFFKAYLKLSDDHTVHSKFFCTYRDLFRVVKWSYWQPKPIRVLGEARLDSISIKSRSLLPMWNDEFLESS